MSLDTCCVTRFLYSHTSHQLVISFEKDLIYLKPPSNILFLNTLTRVAIQKSNLLSSFLRLGLYENSIRGDIFF